MGATLLDLFSSTRKGVWIDRWRGDAGWLIQTFRHHSCKKSLAQTAHYLNALNSLHPPHTGFYIATCPELRGIRLDWDAWCSEYIKRGMWMTSVREECCISLWTSFLTDKIIMRKLWSCLYWFLYVVWVDLTPGDFHGSTLLHSTTIYSPSQLRHSFIAATRSWSALRVWLMGEAPHQDSWGVCLCF